MKLSFFDDQGWCEVAEYPYPNWQAEVEAGDTRLGYQNWVISQCESNDIEYEIVDGEAPEDQDLPRHEMSGEHYEQWLYEVSDLNTRRGFDSWMVHELVTEAAEAELDRLEMDQKTPTVSARKSSPSRL